MNIRVRVLSVIAPLLLAACASSPPPPVAAATPPGSADTSAATGAATDANRPPPPPGQKRYKWSKASEAEVAAALEKKFQEAAKSYVQLKRGDQLMFCKKYREMGSSIRTLHCITEAELRKQVEDNDEVRQQMRNKMGHCDITSGCQAGG
jgi:hypothetical protein